MVLYNIDFIRKNKWTILLVIIALIIFSVYAYLWLADPYLKITFPPVLPIMIVSVLNIIFARKYIVRLAGTSLIFSAWIIWYLFV